MIMLFLLLVAAIVAGAYISRQLRGKSPCGCKDAAVPAEPQKV